MHRLKEIEEFPQALNNSQMWNWHSRMFLSEARTNLTEEERTGATGRYTKAELDELETTLIEHEKWLGEWAEKQKKVPMNHDPVIETEEMRTRAKVLEVQLQRLVQKKPLRVRTKSSSSSSSSTTQDAQQTDESTSKQSTSKHDEL